MPKGTVVSESNGTANFTASNRSWEEGRPSEKRIITGQTVYGAPIVAETAVVLAPQVDQGPPDSLAEQSTSTSICNDDLPVAPIVRETTGVHAPSVDQNPPDPFAKLPISTFIPNIDLIPQRIPIPSPRQTGQAPALADSNLQTPAEVIKSVSATDEARFPVKNRSQTVQPNASPRGEDCYQRGNEIRVESAVPSPNLQPSASLA